MIKKAVAQKLSEQRNYFKPFNYPWAYDAWLKHEQSHWLHTEVPMAEDVKDWKKKLGLLKNIDWSRQNTKVWEGRALIAGKVSKNSTNVSLTTNAIKQKLGLELSPEEKRLEQAYKRG